MSGQINGWVNVAGGPSSLAYLQGGISTDNGKSAIIPNASGINIIVGPNNSGKTHLLHRLFQVQSLSFTSYRRQEALIAALRDLAATAQPYWPDVHDELNKSLTVPTGLSTFFNEVVHLKNTHLQKRDEHLDQRIKRTHKAIARSVSTRQYPPASRVLLPSLRTLRHLRSDGDPITNHLSSAIRVQGSTAALNIFSGYSILTQLRKLSLGGRKGRERLAAFENFISTECFGGREFRVSPFESESDQYIECAIGNDPPLSIERLGDGVSQLILLTFPVFFEPEQAFFVDEPELHLHPSLQRSVLRAYERFSDSALFFITTHSNHLVDFATSEMSSCSLYSISRTGIDRPSSGMDGPKVHLRSVAPGDIELLNALGVRVSSVSRVNATIWVEGITDRLYIRRFLELFQSQLPSDSPPLREDIHYGFVEYSGANIAHFDFSSSGLDESARIRAERLTGTAIVVADHDGGKEWRDSRLLEQLSARYIVTPGREIENTLPSSVLETLAQARGVEVHLHRREYIDVRLGPYLDQALGASGAGFRFSDAGGAIKNKRRFCQMALDHLQSWSQLDTDVQDWIADLHARLVDANL